METYTSTVAEKAGVSKIDIGKIIAMIMSLLGACPKAPKAEDITSGGGWGGAGVIRRGIRKCHRAHEIDFGPWSEKADRIIAAMQSEAASIPPAEVEGALELVPMFAGD